MPAHRRRASPPGCETILLFALFVILGKEQSVFSLDSIAWYRPQTFFLSAWGDGLRRGGCDGRDHGSYESDSARTHSSAGVAGRAQLGICMARRGENVDDPN